VFIAFFFSRTSVDEIVRYAKQADPLFLFLAFFAHYVSYLFRGGRWKKMLQPAGFSGTTLDLAKIIFLFQSLDCILPAKLADVYGAHLMKLNFALGRSFSLGSIFLWRIIDYLTVLTIAGISAFILFERTIPAELISAMKVIGPALVIFLGVVGLFFRYHTRISSRFKSEKLRQLIHAFREGLQLNRRILPSLLFSTMLIWGGEILRFYFVCKAMGVEIALSSTIFVTLFAMLLTVFPFTPAGLGAVELGMLKLLGFVGITGQIVYPLIIWDRIIAHWSQILLGIVFVLFSKPIKLKVWQTEEDQISPPERDLVRS
jgi:uncharacterized protein (TIRG00374 family)